MRGRHAGSQRPPTVAERHGIRAAASTPAPNKVPAAAAGTTAPACERRPEHRRLVTLGALFSRRHGRGGGGGPGPEPHRPVTTARRAYGRRGAGRRRRHQRAARNPIGVPGPPGRQNRGTNGVGTSGRLFDMKALVQYVLRYSCFQSWLKNRLETKIFRLLVGD